ncbi:hypothetical protein EVAR_9355_1 [Eumeta japonica]|uniref:Uncharacterized protein n=1 Tax=Eumeta variegata TaxID=151549 RepID=A0A4C1YVG4_EUMVA|nr:hypothetical protein EVAR_9355_1 [Eumeta japonica]
MEKSGCPSLPTPLPPTPTPPRRGERSEEIKGQIRCATEIFNISPNLSLPNAIASSGNLKNGIFYRIKPMHRPNPKPNTTISALIAVIARSHEREGAGAIVNYCHAVILQVYDLFFKHLGLCTSRMRPTGASP